MNFLKNSSVSISFNENGELTSIKNLDNDREMLLKAGIPFEVWVDEYAFFDQEPKEPEEFFSKKLDFSYNGCETSEKEMTLTYSCSEAVVRVNVRIDGYEIGMDMELDKKIPSERKFLPVFPKINGIDMDEEKGARMLVMNKAGYVDKCWISRGGFYGNTRQHSAQFGCLFDESTCLGFLVKDLKFRGKDISYQKPCFEIRWISENRLGEGETLVLPETSFLVYKGSWMRTAEAYGDWFRENAKPDPVADSIIDDSVNYQPGMTKRLPGEHVASFGGWPAFNTFDDLYEAHVYWPADKIEYSFFCQRSADAPHRVQNFDGVWRRATDGWNQIRSDMGGVEAMRRGIAKLHKMDKHITFYIEGWLVPMESDLYIHKPEAITWLILDSKQNRMTIYGNEYYFHQCSGTGWADHVAEMVARLIRETDCDGVRLDSLGARFAPCYNKNHHHESPYDYNKWMFELLEKVSKAARAVKPDIILSTEHPVDYFAIHFNEAEHNYGVKDGPAPLTVALPHYRIVDLKGDILGQLTSLFPKGNHHYIPWIEAHRSVHNIYQRGKIREDAKTDTEGSVCRRLSLDGEDLLIFVRPDANEFINSNNKADLNKNIITLVDCPLDYIPQEAYELDLIKGTTERLRCYYDGEEFHTKISSPLSLVYIRRDVGGALLNVSVEKTDECEYEFTVTTPSKTVKEPIPAIITIKELCYYEGYDAIECTVPGKVKVKFPKECVTGKYRALFSGEGITTAMKVVSHEKPEFEEEMDNGSESVTLTVENIGQDEYEFNAEFADKEERMPIPVKLRINGLIEYEGYNSIDMTVPGKLKVKFPGALVAGNYKAVISGERIEEASVMVIHKGGGNNSDGT